MVPALLLVNNLGSYAFDIVSPEECTTNNVIVNHAMSAALRDEISVLMN